MNLTGLPAEQRVPNMWPILDSVHTRPSDGLWPLPSTGGRPPALQYTAISAIVNRKTGGDRGGWRGHATFTATPLKRDHEGAYPDSPVGRSDEGVTRDIH